MSVGNSWPGAPFPGDASDQVVGEAHGVSRSVVLRYRKRHGIPASGKPGRPRGAGAWVPSTDPRPGEALDRVVAEAAGVSVVTVLRYRKRNSIPAACVGRPPTFGGAVPAAPVVPAAASE